MRSAASRKNTLLPACAMIAAMLLWGTAASASSTAAETIAASTGTAETATAAIGQTVGTSTGLSQLSTTAICAAETAETGAAETAATMEQNPPGFQPDLFTSPQFGSPLDQVPSDGLDRARDTTARRVRKPLESYFFDDSIRKKEIFVWNVDLYRNAVHMTTVDTLLSGLQLWYPFIRKGVGDAYQGNMGGATIPLAYADRPHYPNFWFAQAFDAYYFMPENARFFNVKKPFTHFSYYTSGQTRRYEEAFFITHAQNISPSTGFNLDYKSQGTRGFYNWSKARNKNLSMAVSHTGKRYSVHAGYIYNTVNNKENGGIVNDRHITDTIFEMPENIPTRLNDARNIIKSNTFYIVQSYGIPLKRLTEEDFSIAGRSSLFVGHSSSYSRWTRVYTGTRANSMWDTGERDIAGNPIYEEFYENWFINPAETRDSIAETLLSNRVFLQIQPFDRDGILGVIDGGMGIDNHSYYMFRPDDYITGQRKAITETDYYVYGAIDGKFRRYFDWDANIKFHPIGQKSGDLELGARASVSAFIKGNPITLSGEFVNDLRSPNYWTRRFFSNHFEWTNSFAKENETRVSVKLSMPSAALELAATQRLVTDKIYYNSMAVPDQHNGNVSVTGVYADKEFRLGGFHLRNRVLLQWSTQEEVIPVPLVSVFLSYFFEFDVVKNVLRAQVGVDGRYNTPYYAFGYMPATSQFFNQREKKIGGYPMLDFYVTGKWKRMRILLRMEHINENLGSRNYFTLLHYPLHRRVFKFGFSWAFYD